MEEVKSSVYLAKKNPWNSSWPFLKYNKEAGLLTMGRAALECSEPSVGKERRLWRAPTKLGSHSQR